MSASVWDIGMRKQNMNGALKLAAQYYMNGGQDDVAAKSIAMSSWQNKPETTTFNVIRICRCGPSVAVCTGLCADSTPPAVFVHLSATATSASALMAPSQTGVEELRVR